MHKIPRIALMAAVLAVATLTGCGKDRSVGTLITASANEAGLKGTFTPTRIDKNWIEGSIQLENTSAKPIQVTNYQVGNGYPGFRVQAENQPSVGAILDVRYNPWIGVVGHSVGNGQLTELPAGAVIDLSFKWRLLAKPSKSKGYAFTVTVTGLVQDGKAVPPLTISRPAFVE